MQACCPVFYVFSRVVSEAFANAIIAYKKLICIEKVTEKILLSSCEHVLGSNIPGKLDKVGSFSADPLLQS